MNGMQRMGKEFPQKPRSVNSVKTLIRKIDKTGSVVHMIRSNPSHELINCAVI